MKPKIMWLTSTFPLHEDDVEVPWMVELIKRLKPYYNIEVVVPCYKGRGVEELFGIKVHRFKYMFARFEDLTHKSGMTNKMKNPLKWPVFLNYLFWGRHTVKKLLGEDIPDLIFVNWPIPHIYWVPDKFQIPMLALQTYGIKTKRPPVISKFYTAGLVYGKKFPWMLNHIVKKSNYVVTNSKFTLDTFKSLCTHEHAQYSDFLYDLPKIKPVKRKKHKGFNVLFVGRLVERKGVKYLIDAVYSLQKNGHKDIMLHVVGDGMLRQEFQKLVDDCEMGYINIYGRVSEEYLRDLYSEADVFVLPAIVDKKGDTEGLGVVNLEAMSSGIPVIASDVGGIPEVIKHEETGLLVKQKNAQELVDAILRLKESPDFAEKLAKQGQEYVENNFNWDKIIEKYREIIDGVLNPPITLDIT